nr:hypothetical protein [Tanacetum cinerariifolium]
HDDVPVTPEHVLVDEDEDPEEEEEFEEEENPQEEEDDMEVDIKEDENEPELTNPYEEMDPLNPPPPASESESKDAIEVENPIEHEDETVPATVHEVVKPSTAPFLPEDSDDLLIGLMRRDINSLFGPMATLSRRLCRHETVHALVEKKGKAKDEFYGKLILDLGNVVRSSMEHGTNAMENLVERLCNAEDKVDCKKLKKELKEERFSNTFLRMQNERVKRDLYWTRVQAHEFYQEMIYRGFMFKERPNEAIDVPDNVNDAIATKRARQENVRNGASGTGPARDQDATIVVRECTFAGFMKCNPTAFRSTKGAVELIRWTVNVKSVSAMCAKCMMIDKHDLCVLKSVAKPLKKTVASESNKKPRNNVRKLHERFGNIYKWSWSYIKFTPSGYMWKPKSTKGNVNPNVSFPLDNVSKTANVKDTMTSWHSIVSNTPLSSTSFAAHRDCSIHRRLWVLKAHDGKSQASN